MLPDLVIQGWRMEILMVSAELSPFARVGEVGDCVAALSRTLVQLGHDVTVALPRYPGFEERGLLVARRLTPLALPSGEHVTVFDGQLGSGVKIALFDSGDAFQRPFVFGEGKKDYPDNAARFALLAQAAAAFAAQREEQGQGFDVVHLHDWPGALAALALAQIDFSVPKVLTIHEFGGAGYFAPKELKDAGFPAELLARAMRSGERKVSAVAAAIGVADTVTCVSQTLARSVCEGDDPVARALAERREDVVGILNGIDYAVYNPTTDAALPCRFNPEDAANKGICKTRLLRQLELDADVSRPLVVALGPLTREAGFDLIVSAAPEIVQQDATLVVAGTGMATIARALRSKSLSKLDNYAFIEKLDDDVLRNLLAAADLSLSCCRTEWTGSSVRKAQRYGAAPVALAVGAVEDAIVDCDSQLETGTGFLFHQDKPKALLGALGRGLAAAVGVHWPKLTRRLLRIDSSWELPARRYARVYEKALR